MNQKYSEARLISAPWKLETNILFKLLPIVLLAPRRMINRGLFSFHYLLYIIMFLNRMHLDLLDHGIKKTK